MKNKFFLLCIFYSFCSAQVIRDGSNNVIFDTASKLMWQDDSIVIFDSNKITWENSISYCENLTMAGHSDWRLPNINELYSIVDFTKYNPSINNNFKYKISSKYWSSTTYAGATTNALYIDFNTSISGIQLKSYKDTLTRCVRDIN